MVNKKLITIGVPCYNEELNVIQAYQTIKKVTDKIKNYQFEFIFVDNGSLDKTREKINQIARKDKRVVGIFLSRNFGPEASANTQFDYAKGEALISIACDLQEPPEMIPKFIKKWEEGNHAVFGVYKQSQDRSQFMNFLRRSFYLIYKKISNINVPVNATDFGLVDRRVINALKMLPEKYRFGRGLKAWVGLKTAYVNYEKKQRLRGKTSSNFFDYFKYAERGLFGFSYLVLDLMVYLGFILVILSFLFIVGYLMLFFLFGNPIKGAVTILVAIVFFGGIQLLAISIIGKYIQVIVEETKNRPLYIVDETVNLKKS